MTARRKRSLPYETVKAAIHQRIAEGGWQPGVRLPSERELVLQFGCARMTVHRALRELEAEGLIERRQGSGSYVAELHPISNLLPVRDIHDEIAERGHVHTTRLCGVMREKSAPASSRSLSCPCLLPPPTTSPMPSSPSSTICSRPRPSRSSPAMRSCSMAFCAACWCSRC